MSDFQSYLDAVTQAEEKLQTHERETLAFLHETAVNVIGPFKKVHGSGSFRVDESNRKASRKDGFYSGELACCLPERNGVPSVESRMVMSARWCEGEPFAVRVNEKEGRAASPAAFAALVFQCLIDKVQDDVFTALGSGRVAGQ